MSALRGKADISDNRKLEHEKTPHKGGAKSIPCATLTPQSQKQPAGIQPALGDKF